MAISRREFCKGSLMASIAMAAGMKPEEAAAKTRKKVLKAERVLILSFDGIRVDAYHQAKTPNLDALAFEGCLSVTTRDVMPSITLPNYTSHFLGAGPEIHGVTDNGWQFNKHILPPVEVDEDGYFPSMFKVLKDKVPGIKIGFYCNWANLLYPLNPKSFDDQMVEKDELVYSNLYDRALNFMETYRNKPSLVFLYSVHTDAIGHKYKWMSQEYIKAIEEGDAEIGRLIERMKEEGLYDNTHILFISDHGGTGYGHGGVTEEEMTVPWSIKGPGIRKGIVISEPNNTVNTASTVLKLFDVKQPDCWTGEVPMSIFIK